MKRSDRTNWGSTGAWDAMRDPLTGAIPRTRGRMNTNDNPQRTPDSERLRALIAEWHERRSYVPDESAYRAFGVEGLLADAVPDLLAKIDAQMDAIMRLRNALLSMGVAEAIVDRITTGSDGVRS